MFANIVQDTSHQRRVGGHINLLQFLEETVQPFPRILQRFQLGNIIDCHIHRIGPLGRVHFLLHCLCAEEHQNNPHKAQLAVALFHHRFPNFIRGNGADLLCQLGTGLLQIHDSGQLGAVHGLVSVKVHGCMATVDIVAQQRLPHFIIGCPQFSGTAVQITDSHGQIQQVLNHDVGNISGQNLPVGRFFRQTAVENQIAVQNGTDHFHTLRKIQKIQTLKRGTGDSTGRFTGNQKIALGKASGKPQKHIIGLCLG